MSRAPAGISEADWPATPSSVRELVSQVQALQLENEQLRQQLTVLGHGTGWPAGTAWPQLPQLLKAALQ